MNTEVTMIESLTNPATRERAFARLLDEYQERLYWYIRKMVLTHENADDVLQNSFIRIYKNIDKFQGKSSLATWMHRIAYNESLRFLEQHKRYQSPLINDIDSLSLRSLTQDPWFDGDDLALKLQKSVALMTEKQRTVFNMKYFDNMSFKQISEILEINENTLKSAYYAAVKHIENDIKIENLITES
jgi:RNA polymerase sigma-70 factor (ECF subfamily)